MQLDGYNSVETLLQQCNLLQCCRRTQTAHLDRTWRVFPYYCMHSSPTWIYITHI